MELKSRWWLIKVSHASGCGSCLDCLEVGATGVGNPLVRAPPCSHESFPRFVTFPGSRLPQKSVLPSTFQRIFNPLIKRAGAAVRTFGEDHRL